MTEQQVNTNDLTASLLTEPVARSSRRKLLLLLLPVSLIAVWGTLQLLRDQVRKICHKAQAEERWVDLETWSRRWSDWQPREADAWLMLADAVQHQNRFLEAAEYLDHVPLDSPKAAAALLLESQILFGPANRPLDGEVVCRKLLAIEPNATNAHAYLIRFYAYTLQRSKLEVQVKDAIRLNQEPRDAYIYYFLADSLNMAGGEQMNTLWLASRPDEELFLVARALQSLSREENDNESPPVPTQDHVLNPRESLVLRMLERFPNNVNLLADQIDAEIVKGRVDRVRELLAQAPAEAESDNRFWRTKGWIHYSKREFSDAEQAYRVALQIHPMDWQSLTRLAEVLRARQQTAEITRIQELVKRIQTLRSEIRKVEAVENVSLQLLRNLCTLARDCGDHVIANALERRLGPANGAQP
ncbi:MAG: hypothetical protein WKF77_27450 [Planctomycetaceae bacterium]